MPDPQTEQFSLAATARRSIQPLVTVLVLLLIYLEATTAYTNTQEAIKAKAVADYAPPKQRADALTIVAEARKRRAQLIAGNAELRNAARKEKAEVETLEAEVEFMWKQAANYR